MESHLYVKLGFPINKSLEESVFRANSRDDRKVRGVDEGVAGVAERGRVEKTGDWRKIVWTVAKFWIITPILLFHWVVILNIKKVPTIWTTHPFKHFTCTSCSKGELRALLSYPGAEGAEYPDDDDDDGDGDGGDGDGGDDDDEATR